MGVSSRCKKARRNSLEVACDELRSNVRDDPKFASGYFSLARSRVISILGFGHRLPQIPMHQEAAPCITCRLNYQGADLPTDTKGLHFFTGSASVEINIIKRHGKLR
jgi:hypothetical protein